MDPTPTSNKQQITAAHSTPSSPTVPDAPLPPTAHNTHHPLEQPTTVPTYTIPSNQPTDNQQPTTVHVTPTPSTDSDAPTPTTANSTHQHLEPTNTVNTPTISINQPTAPSRPPSNSAPLPTQLISDNASPPLAPPTQIEYPYGYAEEVGVSTSQIPNAGRGLFGLRPLQEAPHLFAKQGQFIYTYATKKKTNLCHGREHFVLQIPLEHQHREPTQIPSALFRGP